MHSKRMMSTHELEAWVVQARGGHLDAGARRWVLVSHERGTPVDGGNLHAVTAWFLLNLNP